MGVRECSGSLTDSLGWIGLVNVPNMYRVQMVCYCKITVNTYTSIIFLRDFPSRDTASQLYYTEVTSMSAYRYRYSSLQ